MLGGVSLARFVSEHRALKQVVALLEAFKGQYEPLRQYAAGVSGSDDQSPHTAPITAIQRALEEDVYNKARGIRPTTSLKDACVGWAMHTINNHLRGDGVGDKLITDVEIDPDSGRRRGVQRTRSLLGILWLQCARTLEDDKERHGELRQCRLCSEYFLVGRGFARERKILCSNACKQQASRNRNKEKKKVVARKK